MLQNEPLPPLSEGEFLVMSDVELVAGEGGWVGQVWEKVGMFTPRLKDVGWGLEGGAEEELLHTQGKCLCCLPLHTSHHPLRQHPSPLTTAPTPSSLRTRQDLPA